MSENTFENITFVAPQPDWTCDESGGSNSSPEFLQLCDEVTRLIRGDAHQLLAGRADMTARLIMAQLAHVHHLAPVAIPLDPNETR